LRREIIAAAASADRAIAGRATCWREPLAAGGAVADGAALWRAAERHAVTLYRRAQGSGSVDKTDPAVEAALKQRGTGQSMPEQLRSKLEPLLGVSLSGVRIHTDAVAAQAARALSAEAFTVGEDIFFATGAYAPETVAGRRLLMHELTHVAQALRGQRPRTVGGLHVSQLDEPHEREAEAAAERVDRAEASRAPADAAQNGGVRVAAGRSAVAPASAPVPPLPAIDTLGASEEACAAETAAAHTGAVAEIASAEGEPAVGAGAQAGAVGVVAADAGGAASAKATKQAVAAAGADRSAATAGAGAAMKTRVPSAGAAVNVARGAVARSTGVEGAVTANAPSEMAASAATGGAGAAARPADAAAEASGAGAVDALASDTAGELTTSAAAEGAAGLDIDGARIVGAVAQGSSLAANGAPVVPVIAPPQPTPPSPVVIEEPAPRVTAAWEARRATVMSPIEPRPIGVEPDASISTALEGQWAVSKARLPDPGMFQEKAPAPQIPTPAAPPLAAGPSLAPTAPLSQRGADAISPMGSGAVLPAGQAPLAAFLHGPHVEPGATPHADARTALADAGLQAQSDAAIAIPAHAGSGASQQADTIRHRAAAALGAADTAAASVASAPHDGAASAAAHAPSASASSPISGVFEQIEAFAIHAVAQLGTLVDEIVLPLTQAFTATMRGVSGAPAHTPNGQAPDQHGSTAQPPAPASRSAQRSAVPSQRTAPPARRDADSARELQETPVPARSGNLEHPVCAVDPAVRQREFERRGEEMRKRADARRRRLAELPLQAKLVVGGADSVFEREADDAADRVMAQSDAAITGRAAPEIQRLAARRPTASDDALGEGEIPTELEGRIERLGSGGGRSLSVAERAFFEPRFGHDLGETRIHEGGEAAELTQLLGARAFAVGHQIVLGTGEGGDSTDARRLLAHELAHVIQQTGGNPRTAPATKGIEVGTPGRTSAARGEPGPTAVEPAAARLTPAPRGRTAAVVQRISLSDLNPIEAARKLLDELRGDAEAEKAPLAGEGTSRSSEMRTTAQSKGGEIRTDGQSCGSQAEADGRSRGGQVETDGRSRGGQVESEGRQRGSQVEADGQGRGGQIEAEGRQRGGQVESEGRQRGAEIESASRSRGAQLETESRHRGAELDAESASHRTELESEQAARKAEVRTDVEVRRAALDADAETRGAELQAEAEGRRTELQADYTELDQHARAEQQQVDAQVVAGAEQVRGEAQSGNLVIGAGWLRVEVDATDKMRELDREAGELCAQYQGRAKAYVKSIDSKIVQPASSKIAEEFRAIQDEGERAWAAFLDRISPVLRQLEARWTQFADFVRGVWAPIQKKVNELAAQAHELAQRALQKVQQGWDWLRTKATQIFGTLREKLTSAVQWLATRGDAARAWIAQKARVAGQWIAQKARAASRWIAQKARAARDWIHGKADAARDWIHGKANAARGWIHGKADAARDWIHGKADAARDWIHGKAAAARDWIHGKADAARDWVSDQADAARDWIHGKADAARNWIHGKADAATAWISDRGHALVDGLTGLAHGAVDRVTSRGGPIMQFLAGAVNGIIDGVASVGNSAVDGLSAAVDTGLSFVEGTVTSAISWVESKATGAVTWVENKATSAVTWVENKATGAVTWVENKATGAVTWVENKATGAVTWVESKAASAVTWVESKATGAVTWVESKATGAVTWVEHKATQAVDVLESAATAAVHGMAVVASGAVTSAERAVKLGLGALQLAGRGAMQLVERAWQGIQSRWTWLVENASVAWAHIKETMIQVGTWTNDNIIEPSWQWIQTRWGELKKWLSTTFPGLTRCWEVFKEYAGEVSGYLREKLAQYTAWFDSLPLWMQLLIAPGVPFGQAMLLAKTWNAIPEPIRLRLHLVLDIVGLVPEWGAIAEVINACLYLVEGNYVDATTSAVGALAALVPGLGQGVNGAKVGKSLLLVIQAYDLYGSAQSLLDAYKHFKARRYFEGMTSVGEVLVTLIGLRMGGDGGHGNGAGNKTDGTNDGHGTGGHGMIDRSRRRDGQSTAVAATAKSQAPA
jgi:hypothetical protein